MKISIVIPTHNRHSSLLNLVGSIKEQSLSPEMYELLIVSNLDDSFFDQEPFRFGIQGIDCKVLTVGNKGVNKARNLGLRSAQAELVLLLDDDCELHNPNYLEEIIEAHRSNPEALVIGGGYKECPQSRPVDRAYICVAKQWQSLDFFGDYNSTRLVGGNVSYKRQMLVNSGELFNEEIEFGGTEAEFHQRLSKNGFVSLYFPFLEVIHRTQLDHESLVHKAFRQAQGKIKYSIEDGFSDVGSRTFQNKRVTAAREYSFSDDEFDETVSWMKVYDWAYNFCCENPNVSEHKVFLKTKDWLSLPGSESSRSLS